MPGNFYSEVIKLIDEGKQKIKFPSEFSASSQTSELLEKYTNCYSRLFESSYFKNYLKSIDDYFNLSDDDISSFGDYLNRIELLNVSRLQKTKKILKSCTNEIPKMNNKVMEVVREGISKQDGGKEIIKEFEELKKESDANVPKLNSQLNSLGDNGDLIAEIKNILKSEKSKTSAKNMYTEKTLLNAVHNSNKVQE